MSIRATPLHQLEIFLDNILVDFLLQNFFVADETEISLHYLKLL